MTPASKQKQRDERRARAAERIRSGDRVPDTEAEAFRTIVDALGGGTPLEITGKTDDEKRAILRRMLRRK